MLTTDLDQLRILLIGLDRIQHHGLRTKDGEGRETTLETVQLYRKKARFILARLSNTELRNAYRAVSHEAGNAYASALMSEIECRERSM